jgi:hypothetical protein
MSPSTRASGAFCDACSPFLMELKDTRSVMAKAQAERKRREQHRCHRRLRGAASQSAMRMLVPGMCLVAFTASSATGASR